MSETGLATMPNERPEVPTWIENRLFIPRCCPVSTNPQPGSVITIRYRAGKRTLEVFALKRYLEEFVGGHPDGTRNMETMIQKVAQDCAAALGTGVRVCAELELVPYQRMRVFCRAEPHDLLPGDPSAALVGTPDGAVVRLTAPAARAETPAAGGR